MDHKQFFILIVVISQYVVDSVTNSTKTSAHQHITHSTLTSQSGYTDRPYTVTPANLQTTNDTTTSNIFAGNDQSNKSYSEMSPEEFTSWFTDVKATFSNQVERIPKTEPFKKTTVSPNVSQTKTTIREVFNSNDNAIKAGLTDFPKTVDETTVAGHKTKTVDLSTHQTTDPNTFYRDILYTKIGLRHGPETNGFPSEIENPRTTTNSVIINQTYKEATWKDFKTDEQHGSMETTTEMIMNTTLMKNQTESTEPVVLVSSTNKVNEGSHSTEEKKELESRRRTRLLEVIKRINDSRLFDSSQLDGFDWDEISTRELTEILSSLRTLKDTIKDKGKTLSTENLSNVEVISMDKLMVVVSTISAALILFIVIMCIIYCRKGKPENEPQNESMKSDILQLRKNSITSEVSNGKVNSDTFMGIPPNNDIWRELQTLPATESAVMPDNKSLEIAKF